MVAESWDSQLLRAKFIGETEEDLAAGMEVGLNDWWNFASAGFCMGMEDTEEGSGPCAPVGSGRRPHGREVGARAALGD